MCAGNESTNARQGIKVGGLAPTSNQHSEVAMSEMDFARVTRSFGNGNFEVTVEATCMLTSSHDVVSISVDYRGDIPSWMDRSDWDELFRDIASDLTRQLPHPVSSGDVRRALSSYLGTAAIGLVG